VIKPYFAFWKEVITVREAAFHGCKSHYNRKRFRLRKELSSDECFVPNRKSITLFKDWKT